MTSLRSISIVLSALLLAAAGCGDDSGATPDGGRVDGGPPRDGGQPRDGSQPPLDGGPGPVDAGPTPDAGPLDYCEAAGDCAWGEIDHEIQVVADCPCLFGCPSIPLSRETVERRQAQYDDLCTPGMDGMGNPCPIDDCIVPPPLACIDNRCMMAPDAGM